MNLNIFRYLVQVIGDPASTKTLHERQCKCTEESSIYNRQKDRKKKKKKMSIYKMKMLWANGYHYLLTKKVSQI